LEWWRVQGSWREWQDWLDCEEPDTELEKCTYAGKPFGDADFVVRLGELFGRRWQPGRPKKQPSSSDGLSPLVGRFTE